MLFGQAEKDEWNEFLSPYAGGRHAALVQNREVIHMKRKVLTIALIILIAVSGGIGLYYQRLIPQIHTVPIQTTVCYILAGICFVVLSYLIGDQRKPLKTACRVIGIVNIVGTAAFSLIF